MLRAIRGCRGWLLDILIDLSTIELSVDLWQLWWSPPSITGVLSVDFGGLRWRTSHRSALKLESPLIDITEATGVSVLI